VLHGKLIYESHIAEIIFAISVTVKVNVLFPVVGLDVRRNLLALMNSQDITGHTLVSFVSYYIWSYYAISNYKITATITICTFLVTSKEPSCFVAQELLCCILTCLM